MHPPASRALRREILRLAALDPDDLDELIAMLAPAQRDRVRHLLREALMLPLPDVPSGLAPWIHDRIEGSIAGMTERGRLALAHCAGDAAPMPRPSAEPRAGRSLLDQTFSALRRGGR